MDVTITQEHYEVIARLAALEGPCPGFNFPTPGSPGKTTHLDCINGTWCGHRDCDSSGSHQCETCHGTGEVPLFPDLREPCTYSIHRDYRIGTHQHEESPGVWVDCPDDYQPLLRPGLSEWETELRYHAVVGVLARWLATYVYKNTDFHSEYSRDACNTQCVRLAETLISADPLLGVPAAVEQKVKEQKT